MADLGDIAGITDITSIPAHPATDATQDHIVYVAKRKVSVQLVAITPSQAITGQVTNNFNYNVRSGTSAGVFTERANRDYGSGVDEVAGVRQILYNPTDPGLELAAGETISIERELVGTGLASPHCAVEIITIEAD